jgi:glycylpeptide N-tetradecanoyltransferase
MVKVSLMCIDTKYRSYRLAPVLIKEITRRAHLQNIWQAIYATSVIIPKPFCKAVYYHRGLNIQKLFNMGCTYISPNLDVKKAKTLYKLPKKPSLNNIRPMEKKDISLVHIVLNKYLERFKVRKYYSEEEVAYWFLPREKVIYTYVIEENDVITDMISFFAITNYMPNDLNLKLYVAYSFINIAVTVTFKELIRNALILAKNEGFDLYSALNVMDNESIFQDLMFGIGSNSLKYYFYNYQLPSITPNELGIVLI